MITEPPVPAAALCGETDLRRSRVNRLITGGFAAVLCAMVPTGIFATGGDVVSPWIDYNKNGRMDPYEDRSVPAERRIDDLLSQMTLEEKTCQLATLYGYGRVLADPLPTSEWKAKIWKDGIGNIDEMHNGIGRHASTPFNELPRATASALNTIQRWFIEETRLGIPVDFSNEGIRGLNYVRATNFPCNLALGASWDTGLVSRIGSVIAAEARAVGYTNIYAPIMDLARDPRWGRVVETYGEDPFLVAQMGIAMARALQAGGVSSTAKHFAVYSEPKGARDGAARTDPHVAPREMELLHLRPWERLVRESGLRGVMSSYNDYDGVPISGSHEFLIDRLRTTWGFGGYVVSDSEAVEFLRSKHHVVATHAEAAAMFVREGGNVRTNFTPPDEFIRALRTEVAAGRLAPEVIDARVRDVLRVKFAAGIFDRPCVPLPAEGAEVRTPAHAALALEAARKSIVLLKNEGGLLPLAPTLGRLLVCGPAAAITETSFDRYGSSGGHVISALEGIRARLAETGTEVIYAEGCKAVDRRWPESEIFPVAPEGEEAALIAEAVAQAKTADAVVVFLGDSNATIGESKSRTSLDLPGHQTALVQALVQTGRPVVAVLLIGRPATVNLVKRDVRAVMTAWFPGEAGGVAIAEALFGDFNPGGKLPVTFPRSVGQLPLNFPFKPASHAGQSARNDPNGFGEASIEGVLYPFGHGLSYTTFAYSDLEITPEREPAPSEITVEFTVTNTGPRAGEEVAQVYFRDLVSSVTTYELNLVGFERIALGPRERRRVTVKIPARELALIDRAGQLRIEPGEFAIHVGASSADLRLRGKFEITAPPPLAEIVRVSLDQAAQQYAWLLERLPPGHAIPRAVERGKLVTVSSGDWTSGFFPGSLWYLFEATGERKWRDAAAHYTALLEPEQWNRSTHDLGFMLYCSYGNGLRLTGEPAYRAVLLNGAESLSSRFNPQVGAIRSWDFKPYTFPVIIDNMMNLELLFWAAREQPLPRFRDIAVTHADTTLREHFRADGSSFHVIDYEPDSGAVRKRLTNQGAADASAWARGQAWALYGYTLMFRETRDSRYLRQAQTIADFVMNHPRLPADKVPYWDFDAPGIPAAPRDSSSAAIICSAMYELAGYVGPAERTRYVAFAAEQLRSLASPEYFAAVGTNGGFLLKHATGNIPQRSEIDSAICYADYYFLEALLRASVYLAAGR